MVIETKRRRSRDGLMTTREVAEVYGVTQSQVLRQIRLKRLRATKLGWIHVVRREDLPERWPPAVTDY